MNPFGEIPGMVNSTREFDGKSSVLEGGDSNVVSHIPERAMRLSILDIAGLATMACGGISVFGACGVLADVVVNKARVTTRVTRSILNKLRRQTPQQNSSGVSQELPRQGFVGGARAADIDKIDNTKTETWSPRAQMLKDEYERKKAEAARESDPDATQAFVPHSYDN